MLLEGSTHSCKLAPCDLSTLMPSSIVSHDGPNAVSGESCTGSCFDSNASISRTAASTVWTCGSEGALVSDLDVSVSYLQRPPSIVDTCMVFLRGRVPGRFTRYLNFDMFAQLPLCRLVTGDVIASSRVAFSVCFSLTYRETSCCSLFGK